MCGHIHSHCGLVHTTANCMSTGYKHVGLKFQKVCSLDLIKQLHHTQPGSNFTCRGDAPFTSEG
jgi:hypothetical protein